MTAPSRHIEELATGAGTLYGFGSPLGLQAPRGTQYRRLDGAAGGTTFEKYGDGANDWAALSAAGAVTAHGRASHNHDFIPNSAPGAPVDGDAWYTGGRLHIRDGGTTRQVAYLSDVSGAVVSHGRASHGFDLVPNSAPVSPANGDFWYDTGGQRFRGRSGSTNRDVAWLDEVAPLSHTQAASTITPGTFGGTSSSTYTIPGGLDIANRGLGVTTHLPWSGDNNNYLRGNTILADAPAASWVLVGGGDPGVSGRLRVDGIIALRDELRMVPATVATIGTWTNTPLRLATNATFHVQLNTDGSTVLGTDPGGAERLRVGGGARCAAAVVAPDFVLA